MKNITFAIQEDILESARIVAAERKTTVNGLVRDYLTQVARQKTRAKEAMAELRRMSEISEARLGPEYKFDRDSLYVR